MFPHDVPCGLSQIVAQVIPPPQSVSDAHAFVQVPQAEVLQTRQLPGSDAWQAPSLQSEPYRQTSPRSCFGPVNWQFGQSQ